MITKYFSFISLIAILFFSYSSASSQVKIVAENDSTYKGIVLYENDTDIKILDSKGVSHYLSKTRAKSIKKIKCVAKTISASYYGEILSYDETSVQFKLYTGEFKTFKRDVIKSFDFYEDAASDNFYAFGISGGTPGGINLNFRFKRGDFGMDLAVGAYPPFKKYLGFQGGIFYNLSSTKHFYHNIGISGGYIMRMDSQPYQLISSDSSGYAVKDTVNSTNKQYFGLSYTASYYGLFIQVNVPIVSKNMFYGPVIGQIGYMYSFDL